MEYLNDIERQEIIKFNQNRTMREAVKKVLLEQVYFRGTLREGEPANPLQNYALAFASKTSQFSNEKVGEMLRATWEGINAVESGFDSLSRIVPQAKPSEGKEENQAV